MSELIDLLRGQSEWVFKRYQIKGNENDLESKGLK